jgi:hypothetical protein
LAERKGRKAKSIKDPKARGEWVESVFLARAGEQEIAVSKPWGDSKSYDFVVGTPAHFLSVQVKSTEFALGGGYGCAVRKQNRVYARGSFDFLAAYVIPEDAWYIIPADKIAGKGYLILCSSSKEAKYEEYQEAWSLLRKASEISEPESVAETSLAAEPAVVYHSSALGRMAGAASYFKRYMERSNVVAGKDGEKS